MKTMTCAQLGGPASCQETFSAETFEDMAALSKAHGKTMLLTLDMDHMDAMKKMKALMESPEDMQRWFEERKAEFEALPED